MRSAEIRQKFLEYFKLKNHSIIASSSLIPGNDKTLLFTNAGMVQFKDVFLGMDLRSYVRAASAQCCLRAGGKHNDLDNVGYTARHHTLFEMLGNFSFGDYFKEEAIKMAWEFLTKVMGISEDKLTVTVHHSDQEAENIWINHIGVPKEKVIHCGDKDNFWSMGDTGPCGPCTEIFYDHGESIPGGPPGSADADGDRYVEIWNLVFMQFNRTIDGQLHPLPKPSVDTGMGLERLSAVMQGVHSNYDTDLFTGIILEAAQLANISDKTHASLRVIADHLRSASFLIKDGVVPSNEGRGYVLRRIIRRALRHGYKLTMPKYFFSSLVASLVSVMGEAYPDLPKAQTHIEAVLKREEDAFSLTLDQGMALLDKDILRLKQANPPIRQIPGELIFKLYDTYGFPVDLTADIAREHDLIMDEEGYETCMTKQRERSRQSGKFDTDYNAKEALLAQIQGLKSEFIRDKFELEASVLAYISGEKEILILNHTPFYPEGGGQVGDTGEIVAKNFIFHVQNTTKEGEVILHHGQLIEGQVEKNQSALARIDIQRREAIMRHHSATHLLHEALQQILGSHVQQKGSLVASDRLRFDFSHFESITKTQLREIEHYVNMKIIENNQTSIELMSIEAAKSAGAMALFGEKYGDVVRTVKMGTSFELCGGTHVSSTGDLGAFKIISESGIASGIRRIEALAGSLAWDFLYDQEDKNIEQKHLLEGKQRELEKQIEQLKTKLAIQKALSLLTQVKTIDSVQLLIAKVEEVDTKTLNSMMDFLRSSLDHALIVIASLNHEAIALLVGVSSRLQDSIKANELIKYLAPVINGKGGGRPDLAQAGGKSLDKLDDMFNLVEPWLKEKLSK